MNLINNTLLFINIIHIIFILLIIIIPFSSSNYLLIMYILLVPFIILHWVLNENTCCLTVLEQNIRNKTTGLKINKKDTYIHKLIAPIYDLKKNNQNLSTYIYTITIILWLLSCGGLYKNYKNNKINNLKDLFTI
jgi:hypothetical protein